MFHRRPTAPRGWELAPPIVEQEIMTLWQEEDLPAEIKDEPGHVPFMISPETQAWIASMLEVREIIQGQEHHVAGRPRPRDAETLHRIRSAPASPPLPSPAYSPLPPAYHPAPSPSMPNHDQSDESGVQKGAPQPAPAPPAMPEITLGRSLNVTRPADRSPPPPDEAPLMPDVGGGGRPQNTPKDDGPLMPEIDT